MPGILMGRFALRWRGRALGLCAAVVLSLQCTTGGWAQDTDCETPGGICSGDGSGPYLTPIPADDPNSANQYLLQGGQMAAVRRPGNSPITLTYSYQNMFDGAIKTPNGQPLPANVIRQSIEDALRLWANVAPIRYVEVPDDGLSYGSSTHYGQIRFRHLYLNGPDPLVGDPIAKAQAYFPYSSDPYAGDVEFDDSDPWQVAGTLHEPDIFGAATHELGHTLGLGHTLVEDAVMYWIFRRFDGPGSGYLRPVDINGVRAIYGTGVGSVTPLGVPEPATLLLAAVAAAGWLAGGRRRRG